MLLVLLLISTSSPSLAWHLIEFQENSYHKESLNIEISDSTQETNNVYLDDLTCSWLCLKHFNCTGFSKKCSIFNQSSLQTLVKTSSQSSSKINIFIKKNVQENLISVPHFIVINNFMALEDFSVDPINSPVITKYKKSTNSYSIKNGYATMISETGALIAYEGNHYNQLHAWNFDQFDFEVIPNSQSPSKQSCCSASASKNGKLVDIGGGIYSRRIKLYENNQWKLLNDLEFGLIRSCATFVPSIDDTVFLLAGYRSVKIRFRCSFLLF